MLSKSCLPVHKVHLTNSRSLPPIAHRLLPIACLCQWPWILFGAIGSAAAGTAYPIYAILIAEIIDVYYKPVEEMRDEIWLWCLLFVALGMSASA